MTPQEGQRWLIKAGTQKKQTERQAGCSKFVPSAVVVFIVWCIRNELIKGRTPHLAIPGDDES